MIIFQLPHVQETVKNHAALKFYDIHETSDMKIIKKYRRYIYTLSYIFFHIFAPVCYVFPFFLYIFHTEFTINLFYKCVNLKFNYRRLRFISVEFSWLLIRVIENKIIFSSTILRRKLILWN